MSVQSVALASLTATYTDSEGEDGVDDDFQENSNTPPRGAGSYTAQGGQPQVSVSPRSLSSASSSPNISSRNNTSMQNAPTLVTDVTSKVQRLVSYFDDTVVSDDEGTAVVTYQESALVNGRPPMGDNEQQSPDRQRDLISDGEADEYGVVLPSEPPGSCPAELQEKISNLYRKMESGRLDMNKLIQQRKDFRNPSIYEKLIQYCSINELGTNYPPDRFDPFKWTKDSYYEELAKVQKVEMEKLEKARKEKTKIEIVSGTAKRPNTTTAASTTATVEEDVKKRKSKWDQITTNNATVATTKTNVVASTAITTLTTTVTGTKATVISAFGSLPKKRL